ncbi:hypothetical protein RJT34_20185 [Clitoria ternatea]|uniref:Uncharacterized protein n=1 Tax=Clitoria ternatea TaxID=43366 RepID=A0AAN9ISF6_CLITE
MRNPAIRLTAIGWWPLFALLLEIDTLGLRGHISYNREAIAAILAIPWHFEATEEDPTNDLVLVRFKRGNWAPWLALVTMEKCSFLWTMITKKSINIVCIIHRDLHALVEFADPKKSITFPCIIRIDECQSLIPSLILLRGRPFSFEDGGISRSHQRHEGILTNDDVEDDVKDEHKDDEP